MTESYRIQATNESDESNPWPLDPRNGLAFDIEMSSTMQLLHILELVNLEVWIKDLFFDLFCFGLLLSSKVLKRAQPHGESHADADPSHASDPAA